MRALPRSRFSLNDDLDSNNFNCQMLFQFLFSEKRGFQLTTWDDRRLYIGLRLPPYATITPSVKKVQSVEPVCSDFSLIGSDFSLRDSDSLWDFLSIASPQ
ncbi:hypothetical protein TNCV_1312031 [Trichonephila clavipes]|nr:hypothetical protein TNCV_1312031 [Trichonephila clavipes]